MKLEVGQYVRTIDGKIYQLIKSDLQFEMTKQNCKKASHNIIDLIEVGDYVNGCYVEEVTKTHLGNGEYIRIIETPETQSYGWDKAIPETQIHSIVTKQQFSQMEYKVVE